MNSVFARIFMYCVRIRPKNQTLLTSMSFWKNLSEIYMYATVLKIPHKHRQFVHFRAYNNKYNDIVHTLQIK